MSTKKSKKNKDAFLENRITRYDTWLRKGLISVSSRVVPIHESLKAQQWVMPTDQACEILERSRLIALTDCICRNHYKRCDNPMDVCLMLNDGADRYVKEGRARVISLKEAMGVLSQANARGLVHLTLYNPDHAEYALCSCCPCCCHELQILKVYGRNDLVARSDYIVQTDPAKCTDCGECIERCVFGARSWEDERMTVSTDRCFGCGLCATVCPAEAVVMEQR